MSNANMIEITPEKLQEMISNAVAEAKKKDREDDDFQGVWRRKGKDYASSIVKLPDGTKVWLNIFPNRFYEKKKKGKGERPMFNITFNKYTPKDSKDS